MSWWESCMAKKVSEFMRCRYNLYMPTEEPRLSPCSFKYKGLSLGPAGTQHPYSEWGISFHMQR